MNIQEATIKALESDMCITRHPNAEGWEHVAILPTSTCDCCYLVGFGKILGPRWNPLAEDLMSDDWRLTTIEST